MKISKLFPIAAILCLSVFTACETSEDISNGFDHEVPVCTVLTDSMEVERGATINIKVNASDNVGLSSVLLEGLWQIREYVLLDDAGNPKTYSFSADIVVGKDAAYEPWDENVYLNDGSSYKIKQYYHKLEFTAVDVNMNKRKAIVYIKIKAPEL